MNTERKGEGMTPFELLLIAAVALTGLSGAMLALVLWVTRVPRRRGRHTRSRRATSPLALFAANPSRPDEGSLPSARPPRTRSGISGVPVADVEDDSVVRGARGSSSLGAVA